MTAPTADPPYPTSDEGLPGGRPSRQRLPPPLRMAQILDAALSVFHEKGFAASRIDDIALRAGLSKGGVYAHFDSKEEIFEALIDRSLTMPAGLDEAALAPGQMVTVDLLVERVIDPVYRLLARPETAMTLRLVMADGRQVQALVERWQRAVLDPFASAVERLVRRAVRQGSLGQGVLTASPWLLMAPIAQVVLWQLMHGQGEGAPVTLEQQRRSHIALLREALAP